MVVVDVFIIVEGGINGTNSASQSAGITQWLVSIIEKINPSSRFVTDPEWAHMVIRKLVGHFGLFGASGLFSTIAMLLYKDVRFDKKMVVFAISEGSGLVLAFVSELIQLATPGRFFSIGDVFIDYSGYIIAVQI